MWENVEGECGGSVEGVRMESVEGECGRRVWRESVEIVWKESEDGECGGRVRESVGECAEGE